MSKLFRFQPLTALAFTGFTVAALTAGCSGKDNPLASATDGLCCKSFSVGADMSGADFGLEGDVKGQFKAFAQAGSDLSVVANGSLLDVAVACMQIGLTASNARASENGALSRGSRADGLGLTCLPEFSDSVEDATARGDANHFSWSGAFLTWSH